MGFNSAFKGLKLFKNTGNGRLNNLNDPVLNVLNASFIPAVTHTSGCGKVRAGVV
jgi:hypothetical protein